MPPRPIKQSPAPIVTIGSPNGQVGGILSRIKPIGFDPNEGIKLLLYGRSGTGKTTVASTFPAPILFMVCSGGMKPGELRSADTLENRKRIQTVDINDTGEIVEIIDSIKSGAFSCKSVVLDHVTGFQDLRLKEILGLDEIPIAKFRKVEKGEKKSWGIASKQDYGQLSISCKEILRQLLGLSQNVAIIAHERTFTNSGGDDEGGGGGASSPPEDFFSPFVGASLTPSLAGWLNGAVDFICQTVIRMKGEIRKEELVPGQITDVFTPTGGVDYCARVAPHTSFITKFRIPKGSPLPESGFLSDPDYNKITALIRGALK